MVLLSIHTGVGIGLIANGETEEALKNIAKEAIARNTGARGLRAILEEIMQDTMFEIPSQDNVKKVIIRTMLLSGAVCGIAGLLLVAGTDHSIAKETIDGRGFTAIMVSWLAKFNPITMILTAFIIVFLEKGAGEISTMFGLNSSFSEIITGIIIFFIIGSEFFINYKIKLNKKEENV